MKLFGSRKALARCAKVDLSYDLLGYPFKLCAAMAFPSGAVSAEVSRTAIGLFQNFSQYTGEFFLGKRVGKGSYLYKPMLAVLPGGWYVVSGVYYAVGGALGCAEYYGAGELSVLLLLGSLGVELLRISRKLYMLFALRSPLSQLKFL